MRESEFSALFDQVSNWGRWSEHPERGALNELTPERVVEAATLVRSGVTVSLSLPLDTEVRIDNPPHVEFTTAVEQVARIIRFRLEDRVAP